MIDLEQKITIKWLTRNKKRYVDLGYKFTGFSTEFKVKVKDLEENSHYKINVQCDECKAHISTPYRNYNKIVKQKGKYLCRKCNAPLTSNIRKENNRERQLYDFEDMVSKKGYISIAKIEDYKDYNTKMPFICYKHGIQKLSINQLRQGCSCPSCRTSSNKLSIETIKNRIYKKNKDILLNPDDYIDAKTSNLEIKCGSCGNKFITNYSSISNSHGYCPDCAIKATTEKSTLKKNILIDNATRNGICYLKNPEDYINAITKNLIFICEECGNEYTCDYSHYKNGQIRCKKCISKINSLGEYLIAQCLDKYNIQYIQQYRIQGCKYKRVLPFDFYLPKYDLLIEFDGWQHYHIMSNESIEQFKIRKKRDSIKDDFCKFNRIDLLRISYLDKDNIENILKERLNII